MTTPTVEIDKKEDLSSLIDYISRLGLKYGIEENEGMEYTDEVKKMLDERYDDCINGINMISQEESKQGIRDLLNSKR